jgi:hypothetical protein
LIANRHRLVREGDRGTKCLGHLELHGALLELLPDSGERVLAEWQP